jgi:predicted PurR-regulated permease PerM
MTRAQEQGLQTAPNSLADYFLLALLLAVLVGALKLLIPFTGAIMSAIVIGVAFYPLHTRVGRKFRLRSQTRHALLTDFLVLLFLIIPFVLLIWVLTNEAESIAPFFKKGQTTITDLRQGRGVDQIGSLRSLRGWLYDKMGVQPAQFRHQLMDFANSAVSAIAVQGTALAKNSITFIVSLLVMLFSLFFIFRNGPEMYRAVERHIPLRPELREQIGLQLHGTIMGVIRGWFVTAAIQGLTACVGYLIAGVPAAVLLGVLTAITGIIPSIGTALVWLPVGLSYFFQHSYGRGSFLLAWGILVVGLIDNFLRPYLVGSRAELPFLALFFALLGGIELWGAKGIFFGPLLMSMTPPLLAEYRRRFLPPPLMPEEQKM